MELALLEIAVMRSKARGWELVAVRLGDGAVLCSISIVTLLNGEGAMDMMLA